MDILIGQSEDVLETDAANDVLLQIHDKLKNRPPLAAILFCSIDYNHHVILDIINKDFPSINLIGCTTDGELCSHLGFTDDSLVMIVFVSSTVEIASGIGMGVSSDGTNAGIHAAQQCLSKLQNTNGQEKFAIILSDPICAGTSGVDIGIRSILGENFPVFGGVAAAHAKQRQTHQFIDDQVANDSIVLLLFAGPLSFSFGIQGGHAPLGPREVVTKADRNILYSIGSRTAYDYFQHYIGKTDPFMNYCIAIFPKESNGYYVLSAPKSDAAAGTVSLNGPMPEGAQLQIGTADKAVITQSCSASIEHALNTFPGKRITAALFFSCAGRKMIMGTKIVEEYATAKRLLPDIPFAGFYCYGEFGPPQLHKAFRFHGTTFVTLLIGD